MGTAIAIARPHCEPGRVQRSDAQGGRRLIQGTKLVCDRILSAQHLLIRPANQQPCSRVRSQAVLQGYKFLGIPSFRLVMIFRPLYKSASVTCCIQKKSPPEREQEKGAPGIEAAVLRVSLTGFLRQARRACVHSRTRTDCAPWDDGHEGKSQAVSLNVHERASLHKSRRFQLQGPALRGGTSRTLLAVKMDAAQFQPMLWRQQIRKELVQRLRPSGRRVGRMRSSCNCRCSLLQKANKAD